MNGTFLEVRDLACHYAVRVPGKIFFRRALLKAVDGVSLSLARGQTLGVVGESGCGKSTTAKLVLGIIPKTRGEVWLDGEKIEARFDERWRIQRRRAQMVHQDPLGALDRRLSVGYQVMEPLIVQSIGTKEARRRRALDLLDAVGLGPSIFGRYPHELSGGQRQRIVLARALALEPELLVCDEPLSALDVSIQAQVINLLQELQGRFDLSFLFISHDLKIVRQICDHVVVMYLGRIVEQGPAGTVFSEPAHPYTQALISAVPSPTKRGRSSRIILRGDPPSPIDVPQGCAFHPRCQWARDECMSIRPELEPFGNDRMVACHHAENLIDLKARVQR